MNLKRGLLILGSAFAVICIAWLNTPLPYSDIAVHALKIGMERASRVIIHKPDEGIELVCKKQNIVFPPSNVHIVIKKSAFKLYLYSDKSLVKVYPVSFGKNPVGNKVKEGDSRTPDGEYYICEKLRNPRKLFLGTRWLRLSYPNKEDAKSGLNRGLIGKNIEAEIIKAIDSGAIPPQTTPLGGAIGIHGGGFDRFGKTVSNWTAGCIALYDRDIEEFYDYVPIGTKVVITE